MWTPSTDNCGNLVLPMIFLKKELCEEHYEECGKEKVPR